MPRKNYVEDMSDEVSVIGYCQKCQTDNSYLFEFRKGMWLCKANECFQEEAERESGRHIEKHRRLADYQKTVARAS